MFIVYSIRFDQVLIYVLFLSTVIIFRKNIDLKLYKILFPYISFLIIIILGFNLYEYNIVLKHDYKINYAIANIEDVTLVIGVIFLFYILFKNKNKKSLDKIQLKIFYLLTLCMLLNSIVAIISYTSPTFYEIIHGLYIDSSNVESQKTVASRAYINGRSIGFFDQPSTAGILYILSLFSLVQIKHKLNIFWFSTFFIAILVCGGLLTMSKTFILIVPFFLVYFFFVYNNFLKLILLSLILLSLISITPWLTNLFFHVSMDMTRIADFFSGGRYGIHDSPINQATHTILTNSPYIGFGAGSLAADEIPSDSLWNHIFSWWINISCNIYYIFFTNKH